MAGRLLSNVGLSLLGVYLVVLLLVLLYMQVGVWPVPSQVVASGTNPQPSISMMLLPSIVDPEVRYIVLALLAGAVGSTIRAAISFAAEAADEGIPARGVWTYLFQPFLGGALAFLVYGGIRGGLLSISVNTAATPGSPAATLNPFGVAAIAGLVGLSAPLALRRLEVIIESVFGSRGR